MATQNSQAIKSQGITLKRGDGGGPEVFSQVFDVVGIAGPDGTAAEIETTHLNSPAKEFIMGLPDEGSVTLDLNLAPDDTEQMGMRADRDAQVLRNFQLVLTDTGSTTLDFAAYVMSFAISTAVDDKVSASVTLRISGAVTWS